MMRKWHLGAMADAPHSSSVVIEDPKHHHHHCNNNIITSATSDDVIIPNSRNNTSGKPPSLFFGCIYISREQLSEFFCDSNNNNGSSSSSAVAERLNLVQRMFQYGMGIGQLLSDPSGSSAPSADFVFSLYELHLELQLDACAEPTKLPSRMLCNRALRKDREERFGDVAAAALRPTPKHVDKEPPYRTARFAPGSFLLHASHEADVNATASSSSAQHHSLDYFSVCLGFIQTLLLCYRRLLDPSLCSNSLAVKRFVAWDSEIEVLIQKLFLELRGLCEKLLEQADVDHMSSLGCA